MGSKRDEEQTAMGRDMWTTLVEMERWGGV